MARQTNSVPYRNYSGLSSRPAPAPAKKRRSAKRYLGYVLILAVIAAGIAGGLQFKQNHAAKPVSVKSAASVSSAAKTPAGSPAAVASKDQACADNASGQLALVSISKRHMWACNGTSEVYDSAVVTGMENLAADLTPTGTYHIYSKQTDLHLRGSDSTGSWDDFVNYWMPFLHNQYGSYGFHDATWRAAGDFGNISPYSSNASHGCVELPLATAKWLYNWAQVGTTVTIES